MSPWGISMSVWNVIINKETVKVVLVVNLHRFVHIYISGVYKLFIENSQFFQEQRSLAIQSELRDAFLTYEWARKNYEFEERNQFITEEVAAIKEQAFNSGALTQLELREFQFAIINAKNRMVNAKMEYITGLLNVKLLSGEMKN